MPQSNAGVVKIIRFLCKASLGNVTWKKFKTVTARHLLWLILVLAGCMLAYHFASEEEIKHPPGVLVSENPQQRLIVRGEPWEKNGYRITPLAEYRLRARVLRLEPYWLDRASELSPVDLALGWGPMSDQQILDRLEITQGRRWYYWRAEELSIPRKLLASSSANAHIIPANEEVERLLGILRAGDLIRARGYLILAEGENNWRWRSSLRRDDTGEGSCEVFWVEELVIEQ